MRLLHANREWLRLFYVMLFRNHRKRGNRFHRPLPMRLVMAWRIAGQAKMLVGGHHIERHGGCDFEKRRLRQNSFGDRIR